MQILSVKFKESKYHSYWYDVLDVYVSDNWLKFNNDGEIIEFPLRDIEYFKVV